ncbi:MAG: ankyrin repeat domain-containing protein [Alphaproteobacteria bacterium]|nr:ankyrin repeat domain-containing protein [Alphaproteobacteria bacterium]
MRKVKKFSCAEQNYSVYTVEPKPSMDEDIHEAAEYGHTGIIKNLVNLGMYVDVWDRRHRTPLHCAASFGRLETIESLIVELNANINAQDKEKRTPLHDAANQKQPGAVETLLFFNPKLLKDEDGDTPLHDAAGSDDIESIKLLLDYDPALMKEENNCKETAFDISMENALFTGSTKAIEVFIQRGADVSKYQTNEALKYFSSDVKEVIKNADKIRADYLKNYPRKVSEQLPKIGTDKQLVKA